MVIRFGAALVALALTACGSEPQRAPSAPPLTTAVPAVDKHQRIVHVSDGDIFSMDAEGEARLRLTELPGTEYMPGWSPDGSKVAFLRAVKGITSLWVVGRDGDGAREVAHDMAERYDWSPDSNHLVFTRSDYNEREGTARNAMYTVRADGSQERLLTDDERTGFDPDWSPDGSAITFTGVTVEKGEVNQDIYVLDLHTLEMRRLTTAPAGDWNPIWSPDSRKIAFETSRHDSHDSEYGPYTSGLYVIDANGNNETRLTAGDTTHETEHAWSPDSTRLVYRVYYDDDVAPERATAQLRIVRLGSPPGRRSETLVNFGEVGEPDWSPTGAWVVYSREEAGDAEIYRIRPGGNEPIALTDNDVHDVHPDW